MNLFGIQILDRAMGDVPKHATLLLVNQPGVQGVQFIEQAAITHLAEGGQVVYVVASRSPDRLRRRLGVNDRLIILDAYTPTVGTVDPTAQPISDVANLHAVATTLRRAAQQYPDALLCVESLSTFMDAGEPSVVRAAMPVLVDALRCFEVSLTLLTDWGYDPAMMSALDAFDCCIRLEAVEERVVSNEILRVLRIDWKSGDAPPPWIYRAAPDGTVQVHVPKIAVTGPHNAGKTSFIHAVSDHAVSTESHGTTVALDKGRWEQDGVVVDIWGTPGQARFDGLSDILVKQAMGIVLVVDATDESSFPRAETMAKRFGRADIPTVIAANKQDQPGALSATEVRARMDLPQHVEAMPCIASNVETSRAVLSWLLERVLQRGIA